MTKTRILTAISGLLLFVAGVAVGQGPRHPNLLEAQELCHHAWTKIVDAQKANEFDLGGHAQKAKEHLEVAEREIRQAAEFANHK
jgi:hypothetical protein